MSIIRQGFESADLDVPVVLPTLNLDFANSQSLDSRITFSRGSIGTRVNKNGLIETIPANQPRFDFDPISGECRGLLVEEQRTNIIQNSTSPTFTGLTGLSTTTDGTQAPDGSNAIVYIPTTGATYHASNADLCNINLDAVGIATGANYDVTFSMWIKDYNSSDLGVYFVVQADINGASPSYALRLAKPKSASWSSTGSALNTGWTRNYEKVVPYPNGWYRFIQSYRYTRQTSYNRLVFYMQVFNNRNAQIYRGDGTSGIYIWGPQVETAVSPSQAPFETSYIPTSGSQVTRSADNASMTGTNFSSVFGSGTPSELSVFYSGLAPYASINGAYYWQLTNTAITERIIFRYAGLPQIIPYINGVSVGGAFGNPSQNVNIKSVGLIDNKSFAIRSNDGNPDYLFTNNLKLPRIPTGFQQLNIGSSHSGFNYLNGTIRKLAFYPKRLSSSQAVYLTQ